jgi:hypothetical protein
MGGVTRRTTATILVLGSPLYLLMVPNGQAAVLAVPLIAMLLGRSVWPALSRLRLLVLGAATLASLGVVYGVAVFWFYGLGAPTGAWLWAGPLVGAAVYAASIRRAVRHPWWWPGAAALGMLSVGAVGAIAMALGVTFET